MKISQLQISRKLHVILVSKATSQLDVWPVFPSVRERRD